LEQPNSDEPCVTTPFCGEYRYDAGIGGYLAPSETARTDMNPMPRLRQLGSSAGLTSSDRTLAIVMLQARLLTLFDRFLNAFAIPALPLTLPPFRRVRALLADLRELTDLLGEGRLSSDADALRRVLSVQILTIPRAAEILVAGYRFFDALRQDLPTATLNAEPGRAFDEENYRGNRASWIPRLRDEVVQQLSPHLAGFWLHGSMSTLDYCDFSDVDTLLIVRRETVLNSRTLLQFRRACYRTTRFLYLVDPYQHHGHFAFTEIDQVCYPQTHFPVILFESSTRLFGAEQPQLAVHEEASARIRPLWEISQRIRSAAISGDVPTDPYSIKCFLSYILLLPTLVLQARGQHCYKRDSFSLARGHFQPNEWSVVDEASLMRSAWRLTNGELGALERLLVKTGNPFFWSEVRRSLLLRRERPNGPCLTRDFMTRSAHFTDAALRAGSAADG
jgi:hypothetical protein